MRGQGARADRRGEDRLPNPGLERAADEPQADLDVDLKALPLPVRAELRGLPKELATVVMAHLVAAQEWLDDDPQLALRHAQAARRRAARLPVVREATAEAAYAAEDFPTALTEYRAVQRLTGSDDYWPVIADCERAIGRRDQALRTIQAAHGKSLEPTQKVELTLVEAGLRDDMGQRDEALRILREAIGRREGSHESQARLRYAYANFLEENGDTEGARQWFAAAASLDTAKTLDTRDRLEALGIDVGEEDPDESDDLLIEEDDRPEPELPREARAPEPADGPGTETAGTETAGTEEAGAEPVGGGGASSKDEEPPTPQIAAGDASSFGAGQDACEASEEQSVTDHREPTDDEPEDSRS